METNWVELLKIRENTFSKLKYQNQEEQYIILLAVRVTELCIDAISLLEQGRSAACPIILRSAIEAYIHLKNILRDPRHINTMQQSFNVEMSRVFKSIDPTVAAHYAKLVENKGPKISQLFNNVGKSEIYELLYAILCLHSHGNLGALVPSHCINGKILLGTKMESEFILLNTGIVISLFAFALKDTLKKFNSDQQIIQCIDAIIEKIYNDPSMIQFQNQTNSDAQGI